MIQAVHAVIGGEGSSGGIIFPAVHLCRDSYTGMALFLAPHGLDRANNVGARRPASAVLPQDREASPTSTADSVR